MHLARLEGRTMTAPRPTLALALLALWPAALPAQAPPLRWGADKSGGEPYILERDGAEPDGFEGELARYLAGKLGRESRFVNGEWDKLPLFLGRGDIDVVMNGYEWSPEREKAMLSTVPYYSYRLRLIVRKGGAVRDWSDLQPGTKVGVLKDSAAERYVRDNFPGVDVVALSEEGTTGVMRLVVNGTLAATVQDDPIVSWYMSRKAEFPALEAVGAAVPGARHSYYVLFVRRDDAALRDRLNEALRDGLRDGALRRIYEKYGLRIDEKELLDAAGAWPPAAESEITAGRVVGDLLRGAGITVLLAFTAMPLAMLIGLLVALGRLYGPGWVSVPLGAYVEVIRGTPVLFQLMVIYFMLPEVGISIPAFWAGAMGLALNYGAYEAENYRAGLLAIPEGQMEAALALGMSRRVALRRVVVPQAVRLVIPPVTNDFISLFKDTSICSAIGVTELLARYRTLNVNFPQTAVYTLMLTALLYLLMSYPLSLLARYLEARREEEEDAEA
jgi:polar amino acid transport system substrate-binding protein